MTSNFNGGYTADIGLPNPRWRGDCSDERVQGRDTHAGCRSNHTHRATRCQHIELAAGVNDIDWRGDSADVDAKCERELIGPDDGTGARDRQLRATQKLPI